MALHDTNPPPPQLQPNKPMHAIHPFARIHKRGHTAGPSAEIKSFDHADEVREFPKGRLELVHIGGVTVGRTIFHPGWRWSTSVQPIAKTHSCEIPHFQYHVAGVLMIRMDDGTEIRCGPGDVSRLDPGHDAWVVGDRPVVVVDFLGMIEYAKAMTKESHEDAEHISFGGMGSRDH